MTKCFVVHVSLRNFCYKQVNALILIPFNSLAFRVQFNELVLLNIYFVAEKESYLSKLKKKKVL